jgi:hypothetical protein
VRAKFEEISHLSHGFLHAARVAVAVIVHELYLPVERKTIRPVAEVPCDGRAREGGRGVAGLRYKYEVRGG